MTAARNPAASVPGLDPAFRPLRRVSGVGDDFKIALERESGAVSVFSARLVQGDVEMRQRHAERLAKFFLWSRGGWRLHVWAEDKGVASALDSAYRPGGARAFDADLMSRVYGRKFVVVPAAIPAEVPSAVESERVLGGNLDGCRIGFDLGASDYKVAAVRWADTGCGEPRSRFRTAPALYHGTQMPVSHCSRKLARSLRSGLRALRTKNPKTAEPRMRQSSAESAAINPRQYPALKRSPAPVLFIGRSQKGP